MDAITLQLNEYGVALVGLNVLLQQLGLPIPAVPTMMLAGALAVAGRLDLLQAFAIAILASLIADLAWFWAGRHYGYGVLRRLCRVSLSPDTCVRQTEGIFERWGILSVVASKFIPGFSMVAPPIAGALRMRTGAFVAASVASAALWAGAALAAGAVFSHQIGAALAWTEGHAAAAIGAIALLVATYIGVKALQRWRTSRLLAAAMISVDELRAALSGASPPMVIDVGSRLAQAARGRIPGALLLGLDELASRSDFPADRDIVLYCACPNEESSRRGAQLLLRKGLRRVRPLEGGIEAWIARGYAIEAGTPVVILPAGSGLTGARGAELAGDRGAAIANDRGAAPGA